MPKRFLYDNIISIIGAWFLFIITLSLWYWVSGLINHIYIRKYSISNGFIHDLIQPFAELLFPYWHSC